MRLPTWVRVALLYEAASAALVGLWALPAPRSFHDDFPGLGLNWAVASGAYNEHYVRDVGAFHLGFALLFLWAALRPGRTVVPAVAAAWLVVQVPHLVFHLAHDERLTSTEWVTQAGSLASLVAVAVALLLWARGLREPGSPAPSG